MTRKPFVSMDDRRRELVTKLTDAVIDVSTAERALAAAQQRRDRYIAEIKAIDAFNAKEDEHA